MRARKRARSEGVPSATVVHEGAAAVNEDAAVEGAAARVVTDAAAAAPETRLGGPGKGDPLREEAVQHVAAMFREGVRSILWDGARRAREEKPEVGKE